MTSRSHLVASSPLGIVVAVASFHHPSRTCVFSCASSAAPPALIRPDSVWCEYNQKEKQWQNTVGVNVWAVSLAKMVAESEAGFVISGLPATRTGWVMVYQRCDDRPKCNGRFVYESDEELRCE